MRYGYIGYTQVLRGSRISLEKILKRKEPNPEIKLSKQIKSLLKTALFQTNESIWRMGTVIPSGMTKAVPVRPLGVVEAPTLLASKLSDMFYSNNADYILKHFDDLDIAKFSSLGTVVRNYGSSWQPIYDLNSDNPKTHIRLIRKLLDVLGYPVADNFATVFCFAFVGLKKYKEFVGVCPRLLRPYICLVPATIKEHDVALKWAASRKYVRVALNASLFLDDKKKPSTKALKIAFRDVKETWSHYYSGTPFVPLCMVKLEHTSMLPVLAKRCNVIFTDFNPLDGKQFKIAEPHKPTVEEKKKKGKKEKEKPAKKAVLSKALDKLLKKKKKK